MKYDTILLVHDLKVVQGMKPRRLSCSEKLLNETTWELQIFQNKFEW